MAPSSSSPDDIQVDTVPTPNPDALMFRVQEVLVPTGTYEYTTVESAKDAPLAAVLLGHDGVDLVLIAPRFVTVQKSTESGWPEIVPPVKNAMRHFLASGEMAVLDSEIAMTPEVRTVIEKRIIELIDEEIRPAIASDGGDITYLGFEEGIVQVQLIGACGTCPSSVTTLKMGIEALLMEEVPEVIGVEQLGA